jgi:hypothetical protein
MNFTVSPWRWYDLGRYRILAMPLETNPYWTTHRIYLNDELVGRQLSVPSVSDCDWHYTQHTQPHVPADIPLYAWSTTAGSRRRGRPRKVDAERELQEAMAA